MSPSALLEPLQLGPITMRNRIVMSALTRNRALPTNVPNDMLVKYYSDRAKGGAGLIISEGTLVAQQGTEWPHAPGIWNPEQVEGWKKVTTAVHAGGGLIYCQLWHLGRVSHPDAPEQKASGQPVYAPSANAARGGKFRFLPGQPGYQVPTEVPDPRILIDLFKKAAVKAQEAGFDGVELHGANGYLVHQFLDSTANKRSDDWGGSVENRARLGLEILRALIELWGPGRVAVKLSPCGGYNDMGMPLEETLETYRYFITEADKLNIAFFDLAQHNPLMNVEFDGQMRGTEHDVLASYRPYVRNARLFLGSGLAPDVAEGLLAAGKIDAAVFGWLFIGHPDVVKRIQHGKPLDNEVVVTALYGHVVDGKQDGDQNIGYNDYPAATY